MLQIQGFVFNFASENTYILYNENKKAWLFDPGNMNGQETKAIESFISENELKIEKILLTHAHIDHVLGLQWAFDTYKVPVLMHREDKEVLDMFQISGMRFGFELDHIHVEIQYINEGDELDFDGENSKSIMFRDILRGAWFIITKTRNSLFPVMFCLKEVSEGLIFIKETTSS